MAFADTPADATLKSAWEDFCERLKQAGDIIFEKTTPATAATRTEGFQYLSRLIGLGLDLHVEYNDSSYPRLMRYFDPTRKQGGDNPDAVYLGSRINGRETYRVVGNFGSAHYVVFTTLTPNPQNAGGYAFYGKRQELLLGRDIKQEWDGSFELVLSPHEHAGNWIKTTTETSWFTIRQFFADWEHEQPMTVRIERVGADGPPPLMTADHLAEALREAGSFVGASARYWKEWIEAYRPGPGKAYKANVFRPRISRGLDGAPGGELVMCYWVVQPDEALLIEVTPPRAAFWNFEFCNYWMVSGDYRYRLTGVNCKQAVLEEDGSVRIAIAHQDPGIPNWLDPAGHLEGYIGNRWMQAESAPMPTTRLVKLVDLAKALPANARRMTSEERQEQLRRRLIGVQRRFRM